MCTAWKGGRGCVRRVPRKLRGSISPEQVTRFFRLDLRWDSKEFLSRVVEEARLQPQIDVWMVRTWYRRWTLIDFLPVKGTAAVAQQESLHALAELVQARADQSSSAQKKTCVAGPGAANWPPHE